MARSKFHAVKDAISCINQKVNLVGVILDFTLPQKTKGTDYFCRLKIIDESNPEIPLHVFEKEMEHLPLVAAVGDIIRLSRVTMKIHDGDVYAVYNKKFSTFALYDGKDGQNFHPYQASLNFHAGEQDEMMIAGLRKWLATSQVIDVPDFLLLQEINQVSSVNLACKVLHTCKTSNDEWIVFLWDGTDAPPIDIDKKLEDEIHDPLSLRLEPLPLSSDVLRTFPSAGTILRVILNVDCITHILKLLKIGQWEKLFNLTCKEREGLWYGEFTSYSKIRDMPNDDILMLERQSKYDRRSIGNPDRMPYWSSPFPSRITEVNCGVASFATLMDVLTCKEVAKKFRCVVRVVAATPWQVEDFRSPDGTFRVRFTLEDPTARIHAFAYAKDGENFFSGSSAAELQWKVNELLGLPISDDGNEIEGGVRNPPWVQCCLKSHSERQCRWICDTKLVGEWVSSWV
ncbi:Protection of Telomeres 1a [Hibiscus trionum]|uniref:Protection of Telomeres 1a n=1 Tax=Hibiscus trionum TaxID=183268 RepID=A0A9W7IQF4_HIBTR|nr:Protection of Telomeres 1a [Hibiscus trionum]